VRLLRRNQADPLLRFIDQGGAPPLEGEVEKLLACGRIGSSFGLMFVMDCRFQAQAGTAMPPDHALLPQQLVEAADAEAYNGNDFGRERG
jgi:hypothetical protein